MERFPGIGGFSGNTSEEAESCLELKNGLRTVAHGA